MPLVKATDANFGQILKQAKPIVVHCWAEWCGPCRMLAPTLEELSASYSHELQFLALNVDENPATAAKLGVMSIPTLHLFKSGELVSRQVGAAPKAKIAQWLQTSGAFEKEELQPNETIGIAVIGDQLKLVSLARDGNYKFLDANAIYHNIYVSHKIIDPRQQQAIEEFESLLNWAGSTERLFQEFFKSYPDFIINDDYRSLHSQIVLDNESGDLVPDFVLEPCNSNKLCDILELKRPDAKLYIGKKNRARFSTAVFEGVAQLRVYQEYFEQEKNRMLVEEQYGLKLFRPRAILVIGRRGTVSPVEFKRAQSDFPAVTIETYDDLLDRFKRKHRVS
jgi:thioredoxin